MTLSADIQKVVRQCVESQTVPDHVMVLKYNNTAPVLKWVLRVADPDAGSVIVKIWNLYTVQERLKRLFGRSNALREWAVHRYAFEQQLAVPKPISFGAVRYSRRQSLDVMVSQDLKNCTNALQYFKQLLMTADEKVISDFEERLIQLTVQFIRVGITDVDHQMNNLLVAGSGKIYRIDLECARRHWYTRFQQIDLGHMLGRLICSHVYACQPDVQRSQMFAERLVRQLYPSDRSLAIAKETVSSSLEQQRQKNNVDSVLVLPW
jgi:Lipopolysaccharide kinase (Kdo/WaaP) family